MIKILTVVGARPQLIKACAVSNEIERTDGIEETLIHTGQHYDASMSDIFFEELGMKSPKYMFNINNGGHGDMTGRMLVEVEKVILIEKPDVVLVYGDTNSTLAGALAAVKLHIPIAHVEAGLRSFNWKMPEEINRILTDRISTWLLTPNAIADKNLLCEGANHDRIFNVGDVMLDVAILHSKRITESGRIIEQQKLVPNEFILVTFHRAENVDDKQRLSTIVDSLLDLAETQTFIWPLHPRTRKKLVELDLLEKIGQHIKLIEPIGYLDMVQLEKYAALIITDSGGVQKEAFFHEVPCVTLRDETEWVELVDAGWNHLVPPLHRSTIVSSILAAFGKKGDAIAPYGDGHAAKKIIDRLLLDLNKIV